MLFQDGRREAALPYVRDAARRGDPRSQYLLGIAYFNGDLSRRTGPAPTR
jgi:TPR repeat protein